MKKLIFVILTLVSISSQAEHVGDQMTLGIYGGDQIRFGITNPPADTCSYFGRHFVFDATTEKGKNMLSILLAAEMSGREVDVWYTPSTTPGTVNGAGCGQNTLAIVTAIGLN